MSSAARSAPPTPRSVSASAASRPAAIIAQVTAFGVTGVRVSARVR